MVFRVHECLPAWYVAVREARGDISAGLSHFWGVLLGVSAVYIHCSSKNYPSDSRKTLVVVHTNNFGAFQRAGTGGDNATVSQEESDPITCLEVYSGASATVTTRGPREVADVAARKRQIVVVRLICVNIHVSTASQLVPGDEAWPVPGLA